MQRLADTSAYGRKSFLQPMSICTQTAYDGWTYTAKSAGQPLYGFVELKKQRFDLEQIKAYGKTDFRQVICGTRNVVGTGHALLEKFNKVILKVKPLA